MYDQIDEHEEEEEDIYAMDEYYDETTGRWFVLPSAGDLRSIRNASLVSL